MAHEFIIKNGFVSKSNSTISGNLNAGSVSISGGTSSQFLKADGTLDNKSYLTVTGASSTYVTTGDTRLKRVMTIKLLLDTQTLSTGDGKLIICIPSELNNYNLTNVAAYNTTVSSSGLTTFQVRNVTDGFDMLSTPLTIDQGEYTSYTAATPAVIDTAHDDVVTGDLISIDCDAAGTGVKGTGIILTFNPI